MAANRQGSATRASVSTALRNEAAQHWAAPLEPDRLRSEQSDP